MKTRLYRKWINQPSSLQPDHPHHGTRVLVGQDEYDSGERYVDVYFTDGPVASMRCDRLALSDGWPSLS